MNSLSPGTSAPDFMLPLAVGRFPCRLSDLRGQPVLLSFPSSEWNPACAEGLTQINRILGQSGFTGTLLGLSRQGIWTEATLDTERIAIPVLADTHLRSDVAELYGVPNRQALFVLDEAGIIRWRYVAAPGITPRAEELLAGLASLPPQSDSVSAGLPDAEHVGLSAGLSRRTFLVTALGVAIALTMLPISARAGTALVPPPSPQPPNLLPPSPLGTVPVTLHVNGADHVLQIEPRVTLLDALRERIGLTGSKKGCDHGQCGACTVQADGKRINSCLGLAVAYQGRQITTIEGLAQGNDLHPVQAAFIQHDGFQCGFCTSGQIMSAAALLKEPVGMEDADVRENMSGNLCRCGAYTNIVAAIQSVRGQDVRKEENNAPV